MKRVKWVSLGLPTRAAEEFWERVVAPVEAAFGPRPHFWKVLAPLLFAPPARRLLLLDTDLLSAGSSAELPAGRTTSKSPLQLLSKWSHAAGSSRKWASPFSLKHCKAKQSNS